jgi:hypothetical protein
LVLFVKIYVTAYFILGALQFELTFIQPKKKRMFFKNHFLLVLGLIFCTHAEIKDPELRHALAFLLDSRTLLVSNISSCSIRQDARLCYFPEKDTFLQLLSMPLNNFNDEKAQTLVTLYMSSRRALCYINSGTLVITDSISIGFFSRLLCVNSNLADYAGNLLLNETSFPSLKKYSTTIKHSLENAKLQKVNKTDLLATLSLDTNEISGLLASKSLSIVSRARLGDTAAINFLINEYHKRDGFQAKKVALTNLVLAGDPQTVKFALEHFNDTIYDFVNKGELKVAGKYVSMSPCTVSSIQEPILRGLMRFHPYEPLLSVELTKILTVDSLRNNPATVKSYTSNILDWVEKEYNVTCSAYPRAYIIKRSCGVD